MLNSALQEQDEAEYPPTSYSESKAAFLAALSAARSRASSALADLMAFSAVAVTSSPAPRYKHWCSPNARLKKGPNRRTQTCYLTCRSMLGSALLWV